MVLKDVSRSQYNSYVKTCKESGFTVDRKSGNTEYTAYNEEGYHLRLSYYDKEMNLNLEAPMEMTEYIWPINKAASRVPEPPSTTGKIDWIDDGGFTIFISPVTKRQFVEYGNACFDAGFNVDTVQSEDYIYGMDKDGYSLSLNYEGFNIMRIRLSAPM